MTMLQKPTFAPARPRCAGTHLSPTIVLASLKASTYPTTYAAAFHSLPPCWAGFFTMLRDEQAFHAL